MITEKLISETYYEYGNHPDNSDALEAAAEAGGGGWINGRITLHDGRQFAAGGGWLDAVGAVEPYGYRDAGEVDELAAALGLDIPDTMDLLQADCPRQWEIPDAIDLGLDVELVVSSTGFTKHGYAGEAGLLIQPGRGRYVVTLALLDGTEREVAWEPAEPEWQKQSVRWAYDNPEAAVLDAIVIDQDRREAE